jgi:F-type H+-transporting ATPase subunit b
MISINGTLIAQLVSFLIFLFIINKIMFKPLKSTMAERQGHIEKMNEDIVKAEEELENVQQLLRSNERAVKKEAFVAKESLEQAGNQKAAEIFETAKKDIQEMSEKAKQDTDKKIVETRKVLQKEIDVMVNQILEKVLERRVAT